MTILVDTYGGCGARISIYGGWGNLLLPYRIDGSMSPTYTYLRTDRCTFHRPTYPLRRRYLHAGLQMRIEYKTWLRNPGQRKDTMNLKTRKRPTDSRRDRFVELSWCSRKFVATRRHTFKYFPVASCNYRNKSLVYESVFSLLALGQNLRFGTAPAVPIARNSPVTGDIAVYFRYCPPTSWCSLTRAY